MSRDPTLGSGRSVVPWTSFLAVSDRFNQNAGIGANDWTRSDHDIPVSSPSSSASRASTSGHSPVAGEE
jgi:hypothetical protein